MKLLFLLLMISTSLVAAGSENTNSSSSVVLGGGCFWCMEALFQRLPGVLKVQSGFAGGTTKNPTYEEVCTRRTGHAEVIKITYDLKKVDTAKQCHPRAGEDPVCTQLLDLFWRAHDPTTLNRQGADTGTQYRSIILTTTPEQQHLAEASKKKAQASFCNPIVTEIKPLTVFYPAEISHQNYYLNHKNAPYCRAVIAPKLEKVKVE